MCAELSCVEMPTSGVEFGTGAARLPFAPGRRCNYGCNGAAARARPPRTPPVPPATPHTRDRTTRARGLSHRPRGRRAPPPPLRTADAFKGTTYDANL